MDVGGWSIGGMVAQAVAVRHPQLVRRLVLIGTSPPGNPDFVPPEEAWRDVAVKPTYDLDDIVALYYTESDNSRAAAAASEDRIAARQDRQPEIPFDQVMHQANAIFARGGGAGKVLKKIQAWLSIRRQDVRRNS